MDPHFNGGSTTRSEPRFTARKCVECGCDLYADEDMACEECLKDKLGDED